MREKQKVHTSWLMLHSTSRLLRRKELLKIAERKEACQSSVDESDDSKLLFQLFTSFV